MGSKMSLSRERAICCVRHGRSNARAVRSPQSSATEGRGGNPTDAAARPPHLARDQRTRLPPPATSTLHNSGREVPAVTRAGHG